MPSYLERTEKVITDVIIPNAIEVDKNAVFPAASIAALRQAELLGLISACEVGGSGEGPRAAVEVIERIARECGSTAMVLCMHYAGTVVVEALAETEFRQANATGEHLLSLAFSEAGSRSNFWAPLGQAKREADGVYLYGHKSWVTSANHATALIWSSRPVVGEEASTLWLVPRASNGLKAGPQFEGLGLRGNDSTPMVAESVHISDSAMLGEDGGGLAIMLGTVLPLFNAMTAACSVGIMEGATRATCAHAGATTLEHIDSRLADLPTIRAYLARMRIATDQANLLLQDTVAAMETARADTMLRVLQCKAAAGESATQVLDTAMRVCGGAAFRQDLGLERRFRDARACTVMAPTTDHLYDFIGKSLCGMPVF